MAVNLEPTITETVQFVLKTKEPGGVPLVVYKEMDYLMVMGISLVPTILFVLLVAAIVRKIKS
jgi:hypothetical protein